MPQLLALPLLLPSLLVLLVVCALGEDGGNALTIHNANEFIDFSNNVSNGMKYSETTVFLDADLDFSGELSQQFEPVGKDYSNCFLGTFDGQGHTISNLVVTSSLDSVGLFGFSRGLTVRNVVIDDSCSFTSNFTGTTNVRVGGIIGYCQGLSGPCIIENSVNMGSVAFNGNTTGGSGILLLGGIAGYFYSSSEYEAVVKNCANYGTVTNSGESTYSHIGGIVGDFSGSSSIYVYVQNCLNYGTITHNGTTKNSLYIGGILGDSSYTIIENCVSAGTITSNTATSNYIGSIVGRIYYSSITNITHSFWTSDVGYDTMCGKNSGTVYINDGTSQIEVNASLVDSLNSYSARNNTWTGWFFNANNASVAFRVNGGRGFAVKSQVVLLPSPADNSERAFSGWYSDEWLTAALEGSAVDSDTTLYGVFCGSNYTVTLDVNGWDELSVGSITVKCNGTYAQLPDGSLMEKSGYTFCGWYTEQGGGGDKVSTGDRVTNPSNHTLHAQWTPDNYTVTLDANGWDGLAVSSITATFNSTYTQLPDDSVMERAGYVFAGWFNDAGGSVTNETTVLTPSNHTLHAQWEEVMVQVEIVFVTKDLSRESVMEILKQYTGADFSIVSIGGSDDGEGTRVIIKFDGKDDAEKFYVNTRAKNGSTTDNLIKRIKFISDDNDNSPFLYPAMFSLFLVI